MNWLKKYWKQVTLGVIVIALILLARFFNVANYLSLERFQENMEYLEQLIKTYYVSSVAIYIVLMIMVVTLGIPVSAVLVIAAGYFYGVIFGTIYSVIGGTLGATLAFLLTRYVFGAYIQKRYEKQLQKFNQEIKEHGAIHLIFIHFFPLAPFVVINLLAGMTNLSVLTFMGSTALGLTPSFFVFAFAGKELATIKKVSDIFSPKVLLAFGLLIAFAVLMTVYRRMKKKKAKKVQ